MENGQRAQRSFVLIGAYGSVGLFHSSSIESVVTNIRGIKIRHRAYRGRFKRPAKVPITIQTLWSSLNAKGCIGAKFRVWRVLKPLNLVLDYVIPFGKGRMALEAAQEKVENGEAAVVITYGMGVYWAQKAAEEFDGKVSIVDLRAAVSLGSET